MLLIFTLIGFAVVALAHTAPVPFLLDAMAGDRALWHMPRGLPATVYLSYDDGPNPTTTPDLLDVLAREQVRATFFLIDEHITDGNGSDPRSNDCRGTCHRSAFGDARRHAAVPGRVGAEADGGGRPD